MSRGLSDDVTASTWLPTSCSPLVAGIQTSRCQISCSFLSFGKNALSAILAAFWKRNLLMKQFWHVSKLHTQLLARLKNYCLILAFFFFCFFFSIQLVERNMPSLFHFDRWFILFFSFQLLLNLDCLHSKWPNLKTNLSRGKGKRKKKKKKKPPQELQWDPLPCLLEVPVDLEAMVSRVAHHHTTLVCDGEALWPVERISRCVDVWQKRPLAVKHLQQRKSQDFW